MNKNIKEAIKAAGGQGAVSRACGLTQPAVFKWTIVGMPYTEWKGDTNYSKIISDLCKKNGHIKYTRKYLLKMGV